MRKLLLTLLVAFGFVLGATAQKSISGRVVDANGNPIPNVTIVVKGTNSGTTTGSDGTFTLTVPANGKQIVYSSLGFETQSINTGAKNFSVVLTASNAKELIEVVVTGINRVKRSQYAGASTKIDEKQLKNQPVGSFDQILQGRAPGVTLLTSSGQPGTSADVIIRGQGTIIGFSDPLYVIDGIPVEKGAFQGYNPNDFASIDVLRDAAASALYGSRASAGIIVVTTKKGSTGKMKFGYSGQFGVKSRPDYAFKPMNTEQLLKAQEDFGRVLNSDPANPVNTNTDLPGWYYSHENPRYGTLTDAQKASEGLQYDSLRKINTDWSNEIFRQGSFSNHQITLSGGSGKTRLYSSLALYNEEGTTLRTDMKRVTLNNNLDFQGDKFNYSLYTNIGYTKRDFQQSSAFNTSNPFATSVLAVPYHTVRNANGGYATGGPTGVQTKYVATNQLDQTYYDENYSNQLKSTIGFTAGYKITENISVGLTTGLDFRETQNTNYGSKLVWTRQLSSSFTGHAGFQSESVDRFLTADIRPTVGYKRQFGIKHDLDVNVYGEYVSEMRKQVNMTGYGSDPKRPNTANAIIQGNADNKLYAVVGGRKGQTALVGGLITAKYTYNTKYTFSASFRNDKSSKLPVATRSQNFYSVGGVWDATKENFMKNIKPINTLRVKASYGSSGNSNNFPWPDNDPTWFGGAYPYQSSYTQTGTAAGSTGIFANNPGNPKLKWETTNTANIGLDFEILNRRIYGDLNYYSKITKDLFVAKALTAEGGFGTAYKLNVNAGKLSNKGFEWNVSGEIIRKKDLVITVFTNGGYNKNRVVNLGGEDSFEQGTEKITVGLPLGTHFEVGYAGVDAATGQPLYLTKDGKVTNVYNSDDAVQNWGTWEAPWRGGFGLNVNYKGFELSSLFSWQRGATKVDNLEYFVENPTGFMQFGYNQSSDLHFWQHPGDQVSTPSPLYSVNFSSKLIHDASFLRLRDVKLAYNIPKNTLGKTKIISNMSVYIDGQNLFMWTKWRGRDPEAGATNINISEYPNPRSFTAGIDITL